ncbi:hypothetical protein, partial [Runella sp.]|uniref:hypothetical protein n=1 Tax=Runella sp. TaxID=1960881 RepID=UPI003018DB6B
YDFQDFLIATTWMLYYRASQNPIIPIIVVQTVAARVRCQNQDSPDFMIFRIFDRKGLDVRDF